MEFTATYVEANTNTTTANVMFADPETDPDLPLVLMFSRSIESPDSDYYFEINDQSYGRYGGLTAVQVSRDSLEIDLEPDVVNEFGDENFARVKVEFMADDQTYQSMLDTMKTIFANSTILVVK